MGSAARQWHRAHDATICRSHRPHPALVRREEFRRPGVPAPFRKWMGTRSVPVTDRLARC